MPRNGSGVYAQPSPDVVAGTTIASAVYNVFTHDVEQDLNLPRPIVAGGTGANNADQALFNMGAEKAAQVVTNYDSQLWIPGSFYSATTALGEPVDGHAFAGVAYINEPLANPPTNQNVTLEARDISDGRLWIRRKVAGSWGSWTLDGDLSGVNAAILALSLAKVDRVGDTMTGPLVLPAAAPTLATHATNKAYVDAVTTALGVVSADVANRVRYDAAQGLTTAQKTQARDNIAAPLRGWIAGLTLSAPGGVNQFGIAVGEAYVTDGTNTDLARLTSAGLKSTASWSLAGGSLDNGTIAANTWYHVFLMKRPDTGVVEICTSLSAAAPTTGGANPIPSAYTLFRRIGSVRSDASLQWRAFLQRGDEFLWNAGSVDVSAVTTTNGSTTPTMLVPLGVVINATFAARVNNVSTGCAMYFTCPDVAAPTSGGDFGMLLCTNVTGNNAGSFIIRTNTSSQIRVTGNGTSATYSIVTYGWIDRRGRDD